MQNAHRCATCYIRQVRVKEEMCVAHSGITKTVTSGLSHKQKSQEVESQGDQMSRVNDMVIQR
jgi:hypothetical protein